MNKVVRFLRNTESMASEKTRSVIQYYKLEAYGAPDQKGTTSIIEKPVTPHAILSFLARVKSCEKRMVCQIETK